LTLIKKLEKLKLEPYIYYREKRREPPETGFMNMPERL
jgi:hypothetical protein